MALTGSVMAAVSGSSAMHASSSAVVLRPRSCVRSTSGAVTSIDRIVFIEAVAAFTAPDRATRRARIASMGPSPCLGSDSW